MMIEIRPEVMKFAELMELTLRRNDKKGGWQKCKYCYLLKRLDEEVKELNGCFCMPDDRSGTVWLGDDLAPSNLILPIDIFRECADVANFAMMIFNNLSREIESKPRPLDAVGDGE